MHLSRTQFGPNFSSSGSPIAVSSALRRTQLHYFHKVHIFLLFFFLNLATKTCLLVASPSSYFASSKIEVV
ncbi:unnamed protein product [Rhodiola kirilowii]